MNESGIYCIENIITHKKYIGQAKNIKARWSKHKSGLNKNKHHNDYLQKAWNKYGLDCFEFIVLEYCSADILDEREKYYIKKYDTTNRQFGYNMQTGGQSSKELTEDTKEKVKNAVKKSYLVPGRKEIQRKNALKQWANPEIKAKIMGKNNGMYGKHHTPETCAKISKLKKARETKKKYPNKVLCIELNKIFDNSREAGKELSIDSTCILKVCRGERKKCGGYHWQFIT